MAVQLVTPTAASVITVPMVKKAAELDPDIVMKRKFRSKCQFRALTRMVLANIYWLMEDVEQYEGLDDVKRRVQQAVRKKAKKKQLLSIQDKAILNKDAYSRTDSEKRYLYRIIGGLKCFKRYPNIHCEMDMKLLLALRTTSSNFGILIMQHVKKKLAAVTYFKYYSPNRVIVRQHQEAHALYFIVSGDVSVSHTVFDELLQQEVSVELGVMRAGDMFGEVSLLHNIPRTATVTTTNHSELLVLMREDFKNVLQASIQKSWDEVRRAMSAFTYFDSLDEVALREGCIVAKMKNYEIGETILGDGIGIPNFVYFVLSGKCQMIENMKITVRKHVNQVYYTLYDPYVAKEDSEKDFEEKYFMAYKKKQKSETNISGGSLVTQSGNVKTSRQSIRKSESLNTTVEAITGESQDQDKEEKSQQEGQVIDRSPAVSVDTKSATTSQGDARLSNTETKSNRPSVVLYSIEEDPRTSIRISVGSNKIVPPNTKTFFMQVCFFNPGASFGFGENMRDRRIVASTAVTCMLMPKMWLLQRNTANIWSRIQYYLEKKIPTKKMLFKEFVEQRKWMAFKDQLVDDVVSRHNTVNWTSKHDIPYSIRMEEMTYDDYDDRR